MVDLHIAKRHAVEIDHCPQCRGVWLNRGELDKIIERAIEVASPRSTFYKYVRKLERK